MKNIARLRDEIFILFFAGVIAAVYQYWKENNPQNQYIKLALAIAVSVSIFFIFFFMRRIWNQKAKELFAMKLRNLISRAFGAIMRFVTKLNIFRRQDNVLGGKTTVSFDFSGFKAKKKQQERFVPPKWKDMDTERKKLGFLYYKLITHKIKHGVKAFSSDTPTQLKHKSENSENQEKLFNLYICTRYNENAVLNEDEILNLKETLFD